MSMSEFERQRDETGSNVFHLTPQEEFPPDFSDEDITFAQELDDLFAIEQEEMPPLFVQTLRDAEEPLYAVVEPDLEVKTRARVFRQLHLKRKLFGSSRPSLQTVISEMGGYCRPLRSLLIACIFFMAITMAISGPAFASGLHYLWVGSHTGVVEVSSYPKIAASTNVKAKASSNQQSAGTKLSFEQAQQLLRFPLYVPLYLPTNYINSKFFMYAGDQSWADGPIMVLNYSHPVPGIALKPISIYEFKPRGDVRVAQVVQDGSVQQIQINAKSGGDAIYVDGQWQQGKGAVPSWVRNDHTEMIWEQDGVVFWVTGDKRDGVNKDVLLAVVKSLYRFSATQFHGHVASITQMTESNPSAFADDVVYLDDPNNPSGPSFYSIGVPTPPTFTPGHMGMHANSFTTG